jgi:hypothetical protein
LENQNTLLHHHLIHHHLDLVVLQNHQDFLEVDLQVVYFLLLQ